MKSIYNLVGKANKTINRINRIPEARVKSGNAFTERSTIFFRDQLTGFEAGLVIQFHQCTYNFAKNTNSAGTANQITYFAASKMADQKKIVVIGAGFAGLSAASLLAKAGHHVSVLEKHDQPGGRARIWEKDGFRFDMGPSWYWMPDVFENYFSLFNKSPTDFYELKRLDPSYRVYFGKDDLIDVPAAMAELEKLFEQLEPGSSKALKGFFGGCGG